MAVIKVQPPAAAFGSVTAAATFYRAFFLVWVEQFFKGSTTGVV